jgi:hypothetical protein
LISGERAVSMKGGGKGGVRLWPLIITLYIGIKKFEQVFDIWILNLELD